MRSGSSVQQTLKRMMRMRPDEIRVRALQGLYKRWDLASSKWKPNVLRQDDSLRTAGRGRFFFDSSEIPAIVEALHSNVPDSVAASTEEANRILKHEFDLLGYRGVEYGDSIDWRRDAVHGKSSPRLPWFKIRYLDFESVGDHKIIWELNRHQHLVTLAKAYRFTQNEKYARELFAQWYDWHDKNPYPIGVNWASSLEVAFRSLSWLWVWNLLQGTSVVPDRFSADVCSALRQNASYVERYLSTYFAPNTHLLGEAVALFAIGTFLGDSRSARRWRKRGWQIILREADLQILPDGMHFEQSTYYHVYALDFFLHARILAARNGQAIPEQFDATIQRMLEALCVLNTGGSSFSFGDDDGGRVFNPRLNRREHLSDPLSTGAVLFARSDLKLASVALREETIWLLGASSAESLESLPVRSSESESAVLRDAGIYVFSGSGGKRQALVIDAGPQGRGWAGHGHADGLSVQLSIDGKPVLIDPGTCSYAGSERNLFRSSGFHNTVTIDGKDQADAAGPFKWANLPKTKMRKWVRGKSFELFAASHAGYERLKKPVTHRREIFHARQSFWVVRDCLIGSGAHRVDAHWHFAPGFVTKESGRVRYRGFGGAKLDLLFHSDLRLTARITESHYSPRYGETSPASVCSVVGWGECPGEIVTVLTVDPKHASTLNLVVGSMEAGSPKVYRLTVGGNMHEFYFADYLEEEPAENRFWRFGDLATDASFVYRSRLRGESVERFALCDVTVFSVDSRRLVSSHTRLTDCECVAPAPSVRPVVYSFSPYRADEKTEDAGAMRFRSTFQH